MKKILLNPGPTNTSIITKLAQWRGTDICHRTTEFLNIYQETKELLLKVFCDGICEQNQWEIAILSGSGTAAMEAMICTLMNDEPITVINAGQYGERAINMLKIYSISYKEIKCNSIFDLEKDVNIKQVYFVENETTTGETFHLNRMIRLFPNAKFWIDATSAFGASYYKSNLDKIFAICFCANKCLQSVPGLGIVIWNAQLKCKYRSHYLNLANYVDNMPFTVPTQSIIALNETLKTRVDNRMTFNRRANTLVREFKKLKIDCINRQYSNSIIGFKHPVLEYEELKNFLDKRDIVIYSGIKDIKNSFRISTISTLFDKKFKKIRRAFYDSCIRRYG